MSNPDNQEGVALENPAAPGNQLHPRTSFGVGNHLRCSKALGDDPHPQSPHRHASERLPETGTCASFGARAHAELEDWEMLRLLWSMCKNLWFSVVAISGASAQRSTCMHKATCAKRGANTRNRAFEKSHWHKELAQSICTEQFADSLAHSVEHSHFVRLLLLAVGASGGLTKTEWRYHAFGPILLFA